MPLPPARFAADLNLRAARDKADAVRRKHAAPGLPVCPFAIAEKRKIQVQRSVDLPRGTIGRLDVMEGNLVRVTLADGFGTEEMRRFTLAHELGHVHLDGHFDTLFANGQISHVHGGEFTSDADHERQADAFASELLMPKLDCLKLLKGIPADDDGLPAILALREACQVSIHAAANRYIDLVERPTALIVSQDGQVQYCARSKELKDRHGRQVANIAKGSSLPPHSLAARMTATEVAACVRPTPTEDRWDAWFDGAGRGDIQQEVLALGTYGKVITVLTDNAWDVDGDDDGDHDGEDA
jgi:hypothetical protein